MQVSSAIKISALAFCASLAFSFFIFPWINQGINVDVDVDRFGLVAQNIAEGNGFVYEPGGAPVLERTPLYPFLLAIIFKLSGGFSFAGVQILQALLHAVTTFLAFHLAKRFLPQTTPALVAVLYALHPVALWYASRIWVECVQSLLLALVAYAFLGLLDSPTTKRAIAFGLTIGVSCLTKGTMLILPVVVSLYLPWKLGAKGLKLGALTTLTVIIVVLPWSIRNYQLTGAIIPVNTSLGFNLIEGDAVGEHWLAASTKQSLLEFWKIGKDEADALLLPHRVAWESAEGDAILIRGALQSYSEHKAFLLKRQIANFCTFWYLTESSLKSLVMGVFQIGLAVTAIASFLFSTQTVRSSVAPLAILAIYYVVVNATILGYARYSVSIVPLMLLIAAPLLQYVGKQRKT